MITLHHLAEDRATNRPGGTLNSSAAIRPCLSHSITRQASGRPKASSLPRSLFTRTFTRRDRSPAIKQGPDDPKGPIGLSTLYEPDEQAIADLVFVHGLNGGSESTWTKRSDPSLFWPQQWLPQDDAFRDVRIHTFGYASKLNKESVLNIHDFSTNLLSSLRHSPALSPAASGKNHLSFVGLRVC